MKQMKKLMLVLLAFVMIFTMECAPAKAASVAGKSETNAIELKIGKKKTNSFWTGSSNSLYYVVSLPEQGKLAVSVASEKLGTSVTVQIRKAEILNWTQEKTFSYNKKKNTTSGTMTSENILPKGNYIVQVSPGKVIKKAKKISITAKFTSSKFMDIEPNNSEDTAQEIKVYNGATNYKMYLTGFSAIEDQDLMDCMKFTIKDEELVTITLKSKASTDGVKLLLREKSGDGYSTIKSYDVVKGKLSEQIKLPKGTYYIKLWMSDENNKTQIPYTIKCEA